LNYPPADEIISGGSTRPFKLDSPHTGTNANDKGYARRRTPTMIINNDGGYGTLSEKVIIMTTNARLKQIIRDRMSLTKEPYSVARRFVLENNIYTATVLSFSEDKTHGQISSRTISRILSVYAVEKYGRTLGEPMVIGWIQDQYKTKADLDERAARYAGWGRAILVEYIETFDADDLLNRVIPQTNTFILHVRAAEFGRFIGFLRDALAAANPEEQKTLKKLVEEAILVIDDFDDAAPSDDPLNLNHFHAGPRMQSALSEFGIELPRLMINAEAVSDAPQYDPVTLGKERYEALVSNYGYMAAHGGISHMLLDQWLTRDPEGSTK
jgi:hypothetical protein